MSNEKGSARAKENGTVPMQTCWCKIREGIKLHPMFLYVRYEKNFIHKRKALYRANARNFYSFESFRLYRTEIEFSSVSNINVSNVARAAT